MRIKQALISGIAALAMVGAFGGASAAVIDFQGEALGAYVGGTTTISAGGVDVRFTGGGLNVRTLGGFPAGADRTLSTTGDTQPITLEFLNGVTVNGLDFHNWISGVHTGEVDTITAEAFDSANNSLGVVSSSAEFVSLAFNGIARVVFDDVGTGYVLDDIVFNAPRVVPEPALLALFGLGLVGLGLSRRKQA